MEACKRELTDEIEVQNNDNALDDDSTIQPIVEVSGNILTQEEDYQEEEQKIDNTNGDTDFMSLIAKNSGNTLEQENDFEHDKQKRGYANEGDNLTRQISEKKETVLPQEDKYDQGKQERDIEKGKLHLDSELALEHVEQKQDCFSQNETTERNLVPEIDTVNNLPQGFLKHENGSLKELEDNESVTSQSSDSDSSDLTETDHSNFTANTQSDITDEGQSDSSQETECEAGITSIFSQQTWKEDLTLIVEGTKLFVSKHVLALASPVFNTMFESEFKEKTLSEISLPDKKRKDFEEFLCSIYPNTCLANPINGKNVLLILPIAHEYQVEQLVARCQKFLVEVINDSTPGNIVLTFLHQALHYDLQDLKSRCISLAANKSHDEFEKAIKEVVITTETKCEIQSLMIKRLSTRLTDTTGKLNYLLNEVPMRKSTMLLKSWNETLGTSLVFTFKGLTADGIGYLTDSSEVHFKGMTWSVGIQCSHPVYNDNFSGEYCDITLKYLDERQTNYNQFDSYNQRSDCHVMAKIILINQFAGKENLSFELIHNYNHYRQEKKIERCIKTDDLLGEMNGYVIEGKLNVEVHMIFKHEVEVEKKQTNMIC